MTVQHGGPDGGPEVLWDFSTNANPLPPLPEVVAAVREADRRHYPDPRYRAVRAALGQALACDASRVVVTAGSSEAIRRLTLAARLQGVQEVWVPVPGYGDYRAAAEALGLTVRPWARPPDLHRVIHNAVHTDIHRRGPRALLWLCEPCNPTGSSLPAAVLAEWAQAVAACAPERRPVVALDRAYEPLRLQGASPVSRLMEDLCWQLWSPNKALGMTGIRAGCMVAPAEGPEGLRRRVQELAPSWVASAEGVALLQAWHAPGVAAWLDQCRHTLAQWRGHQRRALQDLGWHLDWQMGWPAGEASAHDAVHDASDVRTPGATHFFVARPPDGGSSVHDLLPWLRARGLRVRDGASLGLPGHVRLAAQGPEACEALQDALTRRPGESSRASGGSPAQSPVPLPVPVRRAS